jgi:hypothetical protein
LALPEIFWFVPDGLEEKLSFGVVVVVGVYDLTAYLAVAVAVG